MTSNRRIKGFTSNAGFTLLELVTVLLLVGIMSVFVAPRFFDKQFFDARGFYDETLAALRYAQKAAIAQRRNVCVQFTSTTVTLKISAAAGNTATCPTDATGDLSGPNGRTPFTLTAKSGVQFSTTPTNFTFTALGQVASGQTFGVNGVSGTITVERETGYVHP